MLLSPELESYIMSVVGQHYGSVLKIEPVSRAFSIRAGIDILGHIFPNSPNNVVYFTSLTGYFQLDGSFAKSDFSERFNKLDTQLGFTISSKLGFLGFPNLSLDSDFYIDSLNYPILFDQDDFKFSVSSSQVNGSSLVPFDFEPIFFMDNQFDLDYSNNLTSLSFTLFYIGFVNGFKITFVND